MGSGRNGVEEVPKKLKTQTLIALILSSILVSILGGIVLVYWIIKYHPKNRELWMVPVGLLLFTTPPLVWFISIAADFFCPTDQQLGGASDLSQRASGSYDLERR